MNKPIIITTKQKMQAHVAARALYAANPKPVIYRIAKTVARLVAGERPSLARDELARAVEIDLVMWRDAQKAAA